MRHRRVTFGHTPLLGHTDVVYPPSAKRPRSFDAPPDPVAVLPSASVNVPLRLLSAESASAAVAAAVGYLAYARGILPVPPEELLDRMADTVSPTRPTAIIEKKEYAGTGRRIMGSRQSYRTPAVATDPSGINSDRDLARCARDLTRLLGDFGALCVAASECGRHVTSAVILLSNGEACRLVFDGKWSRPPGGEATRDERDARSLAKKVTRALIGATAEADTHVIQKRAKGISLWVLMSKEDWRELHNRCLDKIPDMRVRRGAAEKILKNSVTVHLGNTSVHENNNEQRRQNVTTDGVIEGLWMVFRSKLGQY
eukprot:CAMPEP_0194270614 /NCGR_PEP_ID=MMETSP0169-20130528/4563_1 /TAXON_ID=218684 /ORGANISM="Corethron pennatum, Strain L29A3" /LENGTH=312 /DNA_ID=CAMNT_0039012719 /DNA_START=181 /DNA_END=1119 /DNA_ORIENTATION=-